MGDITFEKCTKPSGRMVKSQQVTMESSDIKSCLRHMSRKNYVEQDEDTMSDSGASTTKKLRGSTKVSSERKLSLRGQTAPFSPRKAETSFNCSVIDLVSPKRKYTKRDYKDAFPSDRQLRKQTSVETFCCNKTDLDEISQKESSLTFSRSMSRKSKGRRRINSKGSQNLTAETELKTNPKDTEQPCAITTNRRISMKVRHDLSKPKIIDHFEQTEEINIESASTNVPKKTSNELKKSNNVLPSSDAIPTGRRSTLSQKHTDNNLPKLNGGVSHSSRNSISNHGKLCRKTKKTTIYHDSNGWILSKGYHTVCSEFWDWSHFNSNHQDKSVKTQQEIEIPSFREKKYTPLYKIEGTEDLSDHVFEKRHLPYETMEKKIKKNYVMQSKYELQKSKYLKNNELLYKKESFLAKKFPKAVEFNHDPNNVKKIEISPDVPVMAFGVPIKQVENEEFSLPSDVGE